MPYSDSAAPNGVHGFTSIPQHEEPGELENGLVDGLSEIPGSDSASVDYDSGDSSTGNPAPDIQHLDARQSGTAGPSFRSKRHMTCGNPTPVTPGNEKKAPHWRLNPQQRLKTMQAALILCLNIGCDPPDVVKTSPCATLECWVDPYSMPPSKALEAIGRNLQRQFEILNSKGKYKSYLDPSDDDFKNYMIGLRARTKEERALVYYNGHGVPKPTVNGEFWVFNRNYTQYIPVSLNDFQDWIASPSIFIWDCSAAGNILANYKRFAEPKDEQMRQQYPDGKFPPDYTPLMDCLQLLACGANETLPMAPDLPADVFTACLTSPIEMALRFFVLQNKRYSGFITNLDQLTKLPGSLKDRRSPLGELYWIFTAVTDTIAWSSFSTDIFRRLFRQDLVTASLFRHFLLAERVMRAYDCTPQTYPPLAPTHTHKMWAAWDHAVDVCLSRLPAYIALLPPPIEPPTVPPVEGAPAPPPPPPPEEGPPLPDWPANPFFEEHLTAFQVWLNRGSSPVEDAGMRYQPMATRSGEGSRGFMYHPSEAEQNTPRRPPYQLPVLLQVLLSQAHRLRALILLAQFVDLGPWAVHLSLEIGIFPYVQRLLQSPAPDVKPLLIFIWARIFAVDPSCQVDLLQPVGYRYFAAVLAPQPQGEGPSAGGGSGGQQQQQVTIVNASEHRAMCAFILAMMARDHPSGQNHCFSDGVLDSALERLGDEDYFLRQWAALCLAQLWDAKDDVKAYALERAAHDRLMDLLHDPAPEVRAAAMYALGTFLGASGSASDARRGGGGTGGLLPFDARDQFRIEVAVGTRAMLAGREDASPLVRKELLVLLSALVVEWRGWFVVAAWLYWEWDKVNRAAASSSSSSSSSPRRGSDGDSDEENVDDFQATIARWIAAASAADPRSARDLAGIQEENRVLLSSFFTILAALFDLSVDPYPEVANMAKMIVDYIMALLVESAFARLPSSSLDEFPRRPEAEEVPVPRNGMQRSPTPSHHAPRSRVPSLQMTMTSLSPAVVADLQSAMPYRRGSLHRTESNASNTTAATGTTLASTIQQQAPSSSSNNLKRTSSLAASLKNLALPGTSLIDSAPPSPATQGSSFTHIADALPGSPLVPEPHVTVIDYVSPWTNKASSTPLPSPYQTSPTSQSNNEKLGPHKPSQPTSSGSKSHIPLSPSWSSLSPPRPNFAPSTLVFPSKKGGSSIRNGTSSSHHPSQSQSQSQPKPQQPEFTAFDIINALVAEDLERQMSRQAQYAHNGHPHAHAYPHPSLNGHRHGNGTGYGDALTASLKLGKVETIADWLPFRSTLFDACAEYYSEPQMKQPDVDEPGSNAYSVQMWKRLKMDQMTSDASRAARVADFCQWDRSVSVLNAEMPVTHLTMHSAHNVLAASDDTNIVSIWDWQRRKRLSLFSNANPLGSVITHLEFINQTDESGMLMTASSDGVVRVYRNYDQSSEDPIELVTSWRVLNDRIKVKRGSGCVVHWQQDHATLLVGGDTRTVRIWDAGREMCVQEFPTHASSSVTSLAWDTHSTNTLFATGHADGSLHIFDRRLRPGAVFRTSEGHRSWVRGVKWQKRGRGELVSAGVDGSVVVWDVRKAVPSVSVWVGEQGGPGTGRGLSGGMGGGGIGAMDVHDEANVILTTSSLTSTYRTQTLSIDSIPLYARHPSSPTPKPLTRLPLPTGLSHPLDISASTGLAFHPYRMIFASGGTDGIVRLYGAKTEGVIPGKGKGGI